MTRQHNTFKLSFDALLWLQSCVQTWRPWSASSTRTQSWSVCYYVVIILHSFAHICGILVIQLLFVPVCWIVSQVYHHSAWSLQYLPTSPCRLHFILLLAPCNARAQCSWQFPQTGEDGSHCFWSKASHFCCCTYQPPWSWCMLLFADCGLRSRISTWCHGSHWGTSHSSTLHAWSYTWIFTAHGSKQLLLVSGL